jgi:hypothetical protein
MMFISKFLGSYKFFGEGLEAEKMIGDGGGATATVERHCNLFFSSRRF